MNARHELIAMMAAQIAAQMARMTEMPFTDDAIAFISEQSVKLADAIVLASCHTGVPWPP